MNYGKYIFTSVYSSNFCSKISQCSNCPIVETRFNKVIANLLNETGCKALIVNGLEDHIRCFFVLKPSLSISDLMQNVTAKSSKWINETNLIKERFEWQRGLGAFSYSKSHTDAVYHYIANQEQHQKRKTSKKSIRNYWKYLRWTTMNGIVLRIWYRLSFYLPRIKILGY